MPKSDKTRIRGKVFHPSQSGRESVVKELKRRLVDGDLMNLDELRSSFQYLLRNIAVSAKEDFQKLFFLDGVRVQALGTRLYDGEIPITSMSDYKASGKSGIPAKRLWRKEKSLSTDHIEKEILLVKERLEQAQDISDMDLEQLKSLQEESRRKEDQLLSVDPKTGEKVPVCVESFNGLIEDLHRSIITIGNLASNQARDRSRLIGTILDELTDYEIDLSKYKFIQ
ncbi:hypothetical protein ADUPG1_007816 [Aduncisulcus paluster]|uniref:Uncharacterized protein n=1 Tax=Aduncisulcus paluster TaxID=2918883 RepID=A0ABQ5KPR2_9EUKA|nr:hypothetical protein ADUPG1_007816 [Aduncisulcus paluster]|eukprot:gnl/Carplike_NY0171/4691_a6373_353.p1 GENE.gnl/Carplike_NY0171/4691_a6373_353~~gnl/Carplike_NY0171/4691_a6373_353.p1  ORF type:complete len:226 (-),score=40.42 gnl/Carplike_NY0171/4691_a6373_353:17-694(-)